MFTENKTTRPSDSQNFSALSSTQNTALDRAPAGACSPMLEDNCLRIRFEPAAPASERCITIERLFPDGTTRDHRKLSGFTSDQWRELDRMLATRPELSLLVARLLNVCRSGRVVIAGAAMSGTVVRDEQGAECTIASHADPDLACYLANAGRINLRLFRQQEGGRNPATLEISGDSGEGTVSIKLNGRRDWNGTLKPFRRFRGNPLAVESTVDWIISVFQRRGATATAWLLRTETARSDAESHERFVTDRFSAELFTCSKSCTLFVTSARGSSFLWHKPLNARHPEDPNAMQAFCRRIASASAESSAQQHRSLQAALDALSRCVRLSDSNIPPCEHAPHRGLRNIAESNGYRGLQWEFIQNETLSPEELRGLELARVSFIKRKPSDIFSILLALDNRWNGYLELVNGAGMTERFYLPKTRDCAAVDRSRLLVVRTLRLLTEAPEAAVDGLERACEESQGALPRFRTNRARTAYDRLVECCSELKACGFKCDLSEVNFRGNAAGIHGSFGQRLLARFLFSEQGLQKIGLHFDSPGFWQRLLPRISDIELIRKGRLQVDDQAIQQDLVALGEIESVRDFLDSAAGKAIMACFSVASASTNLKFWAAANRESIHLP